MLRTELQSSRCIGRQAGGTGLVAADVVRAVLRRRAHDPDFRRRFEREPEQLLSRYALEDDEREALVTNNHAMLWLWGIPDELFPPMSAGADQAASTSSA